jgi:hypothetical protein
LEFFGFKNKIKKEGWLCFRSFASAEYYSNGILAVSGMQEMKFYEASKRNAGGGATAILQLGVLTKWCLTV